MEAKDTLFGKRRKKRKERKKTKKTERDEQRAQPKKNKPNFSYRHSARFRNFRPPASPALLVRLKKQADVSVACDLLCLNARTWRKFRECRACCARVVWVLNTDPSESRGSNCRPVCCRILAIFRFSALINNKDPRLQEPCRSNPWCRMSASLASQMAPLRTAAVWRCMMPPLRTTRGTRAPFTGFALHQVLKPFRVCESTQIC